MEYEDFGYEDEDFGYDDDEVGIRMPWNRKKKKSSGRRPASRAASLRSKIQEKALSGTPEPTVGRRVLGLGYGDLKSGTTTLTLAATVQEMFRVRKPIIEVKYNSSWTSGLVIMTEFKIGNKSQFLGTEGGPAEGFNSNATDVNLLSNVANPGQEISMTFIAGGSTAIATNAQASISAFVTGESIG